jgi:Spy/CpxP family protein refolding chaperone
MKRSVKIITAVVLSCGIAGGAVAYGKHQWGNPANKAQHVVSYVSEELDLDSDQSEKLAVLSDQILQTGKIVREELAANRSELTALIAADSFDQQQAMAMLSSKTALMHQYAPDVLGALGEFLDSLNAEQKAQVIEVMQHKRGHRGWNKH